MTTKKNKIIISFDNAEKGLIAKDDIHSKFYIAGYNKIFVWAQAKIIGNTVVLSAKEIKAPVAVRFNFTNTDISNLFFNEGLPVNLFRTDNWDVVTIPSNK